MTLLEGIVAKLEPVVPSLYYSTHSSNLFPFPTLFELSVSSANTLLLLRFRAIFEHVYDASLDQCSLMSLTVAGFVEPWAVDAEKLRHSK